MATPQDSAYHLGAGDQIRVITYDEPQLSNTFIVGSDGVIEFPLVGRINAEGMTPGGLAAQLGKDLQAGKLLSNPSVSVEIAQYRPISVLGEVNHPGQYQFEPGMTMLDAVALAGGFTYRAVTDHAGDLRHDSANGQAVEGNITRGAPLEPGDVITVYEKYF
jgi:polysaccharide export outer membrane protein